MLPSADDYKAYADLDKMVQAAVDHWACYIDVARPSFVAKPSNLTSEQIEAFKRKLTELLSYQLKNNGSCWVKSEYAETEILAEACDEASVCATVTKSSLYVDLKSGIIKAHGFGEPDRNIYDRNVIEGEFRVVHPGPVSQKIAEQPRPGWVRALKGAGVKNEE